MSSTPRERAGGAVELALGDSRWLEFVSRSPHSTAFHHPAWGLLLAECYGFRTFALAATDASGRISAGLPVAEVTVPLRGRRWVSLPFTDYLTPLAADDAARVRLVGELASRRTRGGVRSVELRADVAGAEVHRLPHALRHVLALRTDPDDVYRTFTSMTQRAIQKGQREGAVVRRGVEPEDLTQAFYALHAETRRRHGTPVQPRRFFELLWTRIVERGLGSVLLAEVDGRPIAGVVLLSWNGTVVYKYSASRRDASRYRPTNLILWSAICAACERRDHTFDFGRTDLDNEGLRSFKRGWGTEERTLAYTLVADKLPAPARARPIVAAVIRRSPLFVARGLGRMFYRYAG